MTMYTLHHQRVLVAWGGNLAVSPADGSTVADLVDAVWAVMVEPDARSLGAVMQALRKGYASNPERLRRAVLACRGEQVFQRRLGYLLDSLATSSHVQSDSQGEASFWSSLADEYAEQVPHVAGTATHYQTKLRRTDKARPLCEANKRWNVVAPANMWEEYVD